MFATCEVLRSIAETYPVRSRERKAVKEAAQAFVFVNMQKRLSAAYEAFLEDSTKPLTPGQKQALKRMGIKP